MTDGQILVGLRVADATEVVPGSRIEECRRCGAACYVMDGPLDAVECMQCVLVYCELKHVRIRRETVERLRALGHSDEDITAIHGRLLETVAGAAARRKRQQ